MKPYDRGVPDRNVVCFVPNEDLRLQALQAGAVMAGGHELIMEISKGKDSYQVEESLKKLYMFSTDIWADRAVFWQQ